jgi:hypothetical protein
MEHENKAAAATATAQRDLSDKNTTNGACDLTCQNGGKCELLTFSHHHHHTMPKRCMCAPGFGGLECEIETSVCFTAFEQDYYCQAGAPCLLSRDGQYDYCDCKQAFDLSAFAGLECDFSATEYCTDNGSLSYVAFCTNDGACETYVQDEEKEGHPGCSCPPGFEGSHCEYFEGQVREIDNTRTASSSEPQGNGHKYFNAFMIAFFTISLLVLANLIRLLCKRKRAGRLQDPETSFIMS